MKPDNDQPHILVADDQPDVLEALRLLLKGHGFDVDTVNSPSAALAALERRDYDAMLLDMNYTRDTTSGKEGLDLLPTLQTLEPNMPVVVMTAWGSIDNAVEAMRRGARDYVEKPWDNARLVSILGDAGRARPRAAPRAAARDGESAAAPRPSAADDRRVAEDEADSRSSWSASGRPTRTCSSPASTARARSSSRSGCTRRRRAASRSFIAVNMGGLSEGVFESELFGHVKGAFTDAKTDRVGRFELADGGTLFLDEIGTVPLSLQSKLLRVLQTGDVERVGSSKARHVDVRVDLGDERQSAAGGRRGPVPRGPAVPAQHDRDPSAAAARSARRHPAAGDAFPPASRDALPQAAHRLRRRRDAGAARRIRGRATSASSTTRSSARCCWRRASRSAPPTSACERRRAPRRASRICRSRTLRRCSFRKRCRATTAT